MGIPDHLICLLRNLYAGQEATVKTRDGTMDWFKIGKTKPWPQDWKRSVFIPIPKKGNAKEYSNYRTIALTCQQSNAQNPPGFNSTWTVNFQMFKLDLEKAEEPEFKLPTFGGSLKKQENSRKNIYFCFTEYAKAFDRRAQQTVENSSRDGNTRPPDLPLEKFVCRSGSNS